MGLVLDEWARERLAEGRRLLGVIVSEHGRLRQAAFEERWGPGIDRPALRAYEQWDAAEHFSSLTVEQLCCLLFASAERLTNERELWSAAETCMDGLSDRDLDLTAGDVRVLAAVSEPGDGMRGWLPFQLVVDLVERLLRDGAAGAVALADAVADQVLGWTVMAHHHPQSVGFYRAPLARVRDKALELAGRPPVRLAEGVVGRDDGYGLAVIGWLGAAEDWPAGVAGLLAHCATARSARPSARWQKLCRQRLDAVADASALLRGLLDLVVTTEPVIFTDGAWRRAVLIRYNEQLVRGLVWAAGVLDPGWLPGVLEAIAVRCLQLGPCHRYPPTPVPGNKIPNACIRALGRSGSEASLRALARIGHATTDRRILQGLDQALAEASARSIPAATMPAS
jgi:hypothetical protein